jgi:hypothetical protein
MYAASLRISDALHLGIFHQPPKYPVLRQAPRRTLGEFGAVGVSFPALGDEVLLHPTKRRGGPEIFIPKELSGL